jgi:hypothetical protein
MEPQELKNKGRYGDTTVAHLTPGEVVLPQVAAQALKGQLEAILGRAGMQRATVGSSQASINPATGLEEHFSIGGFHPFRSSTYTGSQKRRDEANMMQRQGQAAANAQQRAADKRADARLARQIAEYEKQDRKRQAETDLLLQKQKISSIKSARMLGKVRRDKTAGLAGALGEGVGVTAPTDRTMPSSTARQRKKKTVTGRSSPTIQIGGQYRPA